jgi:hypothetical protein
MRIPNPKVPPDGWIPRPGQIPNIPIDTGIPHHFLDEIAAQSGVVKAIGDNSLFDCFGNTLLGQGAFGIPQAADAGSGKSPAPEMDAGTVHTKLQAYSAIICTLPSHEHHTCSFSDTLRYLIGSSSSFQDQALRRGYSQRRRQA